jgi:hypothetical protein
MRRKRSNYCIALAQKFPLEEIWWMKAVGCHDARVKRAASPNGEE